MRIPHAALLFMVLPASAPAAVTIKAIAANGNHSLAQDSDGTVWEWGGRSSAPTRVSGLTGVVSVAAGFDNGLAVRNDGTVWACLARRDEFCGRLERERPEQFQQSRGRSDGGVGWCDKGMNRP